MSEHVNIVCTGCRERDQKLDALSPKWRRFDKDDETTWPEDGRYWVALGDNTVDDDEFRTYGNIARTRGWRGFMDGDVSHWAPFPIPSPPEEGEE